MKEHSSYKNLYDLEITPPTEQWTKIVQQMDQQTHARIAEKVQAAAVTPPASVWKRIEQQLYPGKIIRLNTRRWISAAAAIIGIAFAGWWGYNEYLSHQRINDEAHLLATANAGNDPFMVYTNNNNNEWKPVRPAKENNTTQVPVKKPVIRTEKVYLASFDFPEKIQRNLTAGRIDAPSFTDAEGNLVFDPSIITDPNSNYLTITGPNGQQTRISSKFLPMITEINAPKNSRGFYRNHIFRDNQIWQQRFSEWREKLIKEDSTTAPATNLIDIIKQKQMNEDPKK